MILQHLVQLHPQWRRARHEESCHKKFNK
jgi:hypothetical protein